MAHIHVRIGDSTKKKAQKILKDLGLDLSTAVNLYFEQIILSDGIPFRVSKTPSPCTHPICTGEKKVPDHIMEEWIRDADEALKEGPIYNSTDELFASWDAEDGEK